MPRGMGGGDNVMGSKEAVVNVAFKDDLGNILENAEKLKDVLDAVNQNFLAINSVVGITNNSMGRLASQTQKLVSTTQQLRNEYQIIADASQRIGVSSPPAISGGPFRDTDVVRQALGGTGQGLVLGTQQDKDMAIGSTAGLNKLQTETFPKNPRQFTAYANDKRYQDKSWADKGKQAWQDYQQGASISSITRAALSSTGSPVLSAIGASTVYVGAAYAIASAAYKAFDYLVKGSTRYSGLTGGTGVLSNTGAAAGSETFVGMQARAWREGLFNMAVGPGGFQAIQEGLLGAGYTARDNSQYNRMGIRGMRYETARSTLQGLYERGLQDIDANLQLMQLVSERGGGSLTTLMGTIDNLRTTALKTNASLKVMTQTMTTSITGLIGGMNVMGGVAAFIGGNNAAAYANSQNTLLRGSGAPDYNNFITRMMLLQTPSFQQAGVTAQNMFYMNANPELWPGGEGMAYAKGTDYSVDRMLNMLFRVPQGSSLKTAKDIIGQNTPGVIAAMQNPTIQALAGPQATSSVDAFIEWAATNLTGDPQTETAQRNRRGNLSRAIDIDRWDRGLGSYYAQRRPGDSDGGQLTRDEALNRYFQNALGDSMNVSFTRKGDLNLFAPEGMNERERRDHPITTAYYNYAKQTGQRIGWVEKVLKNPDGRAAGQTYVKFGGQVLNLKQFLEAAKTNKTYDAALRGETSSPLLVGTRERGEKQSDIDNWMDSGEFGGGGAGGGPRKMAEMTKGDFAMAVRDGLIGFNKVTAEGLKVDMGGF